MSITSLNVLGHEPVDASLVRRDARLSFRSLPDLLDDPLSACLGVLHSRLGLAVPLDVAALDAPVSEAVPSQIHVADAESPGRCWRRHRDGLLRHGGRVLEAHLAGRPVA